jgi:Domain of unknown function (DUF1906)
VAEGVDYSWTRPNPGCLYGSGKRFVCRYLGDDDTGENLHPPERDALHAAGLSIVLNWQTGKSFMLEGGFDEGKVDANIAKTQARELGAPDDRPIYFSLDVDPNNRDTEWWARVEDYLAGVHEILGRDRTGVYGGWAAIERLIPNHAKWGWQTYAWSAGRWSLKAHLQQYRNGVDLCGGLVDLDRTLVVGDYGQWPPH